MLHFLWMFECFHPFLMVLLPTSSSLKCDHILFLNQKQWYSFGYHLKDTAFFFSSCLRVLLGASISHSQLPERSLNLLVWGHSSFSYSFEDNSEVWHPPTLLCLAPLLGFCCWTQMNRLGFRKQIDLHIFRLQKHTTVGLLAWKQKGKCVSYLIYLFLALLAFDHAPLLHSAKLIIQDQAQISIFTLNGHNNPCS